MTQRTDTPPTWDERTQLVTFLNYARDTARAKCEGVSAEDARKAPIPSSPLMTVCGLISHLRWVEYYWFQVMFLGEELAGPLNEATDDDPDPEMRTAADIPLPQLLAETRSRAPATVAWCPTTTWTQGPSVPSATAATSTSGG